MKIVFFGGRHVEGFIFELKENFDISLVVTTDEQMAKRAAEEKVPFTKILEIEDNLIKEIKKIKPELGIVADFGIILPKKLIDIFPKGILNVHPSLLPKYRGPTPVQSAILNGDKKTGITIIKIDEKMDHGPILYQEEFEIKPGDFTDRLLPFLFHKASEILPGVIADYSTNSFPPQQQDDRKASYTKILTRDDGYVDINNPPGKEKLIRMINALSPWPGAWTRFRLSSSGQAKIIKLHPQGIIHVEGKKPMNFKDFKNGYAKGEEFLKKLGLV